MSLKIMLIHYVNYMYYIWLTLTHFINLGDAIPRSAISLGLGDAGDAGATPRGGGGHAAAAGAGHQWRDVCRVAGVGRHRHAANGRAAVLHVELLADYGAFHWKS